ncbi:MAG: hypothetical protein ACQETJ_11445 [Bacteroidota bacterium]
MKIKELPKQFNGRGEVKGFKFFLLSKTKQGFCYEVHSNGINTHYEVFRLKINNRFACVSYPTSKAFGIWAWTYKCPVEANVKLHSL